jgi:hypothetical protein
METNEAAAALAHAKRGAMQAAAGCGKTMVISVAVARHGGGRELVLTHTHAGVDALRRRLVELGAPIRSYKLDTIAGWALRLAASFPCAASLSNCKPRTDDDYSTVYRGAEILVRLKPIQEILQASYSGVYVDEYQDCSIEQHALVVALSMVLPCRIVGDPLQGIFDFRGIPVVDWSRHVASQFKEVPGPTVAWRWQNSNPDLGTWLQAVRCKLLAGAGVNLRDAPIRWLSSNTEIARRNNQRQACFDSVGINGDSVVAIHQWPGQCHDISRRLNGSFSCVEPIDVDDLFKFARLIDSTSGLDRAIAVLDFASKCMTGIRTQLSTIRKAFEKNRVPAIRKYKMQLDVLLAVANSGDPRVINTALDALNRIPSVVIFRRELLNEMFRTVRAYADGEAPSMSEAAWVVRSRTRQIGRRLPRCVIGTTLLVKGLEFDHAVILDADAHDAKNLYVALTRGSKTLTIVSKSSFLQPRK